MDGNPHGSASTTTVDGTRYYNRDVRSQLRTGDVLLFRGFATREVHLSNGHPAVRPVA